MVQVKPVWSALQVQFALKKPIFDWEHMQGRFFSMIYEALSETLPLNSKEFSAVGANQLSEVKAKYSVYGGPSSVSLTSDALLLDFPGLLPSDRGLVENIVVRVHDAFNQTFRELVYQTVVVQLLQHLEFLKEKPSPTEYLYNFAVPIAKAVKSVVVHPGTKFELISENQAWKCAVGIERSIANARAVFATFNMTMDNAGPSVPFETKAQTVRTIYSTCLGILELEVPDAIG